MKKITKEFLKKHEACRSGYEWYLEQKTTDAAEIFKRLIKEDKLSDANWVICRMFNCKQKIQYAIFAAEQVIEIFEKKYPEDKRPRAAIEAAKLCLKNNTEKNRDASYAASYASYASYAAANAANAANAASYASYAAYAAAYAAANAANAANAASYASYAAYAAAYAAANAANAAEKEMKIRILNYGLELLKLK